VDRSGGDERGIASIRILKVARLFSPQFQDLIWAVEALEEIFPSKLPLLLALLTGISLLGMQPGAQSTLAAQQEETNEGKDIEWKDFLKSLNRPNEVLELRGEKARHFKNADGSYSALIAPTPIHYRDEQGNWQEIEIDITKSSGGFENVKNGIKSWFPTTSTAMKIGISEEEAYSWTPPSNTNKIQ
jgi:hypothetical protein